MAWSAGIATAALLGLSALGLLVSAYFTLVAYGLMAPDARLLPRACRMDEETCARVIDTKYGRVAGAPNAAYGIAWYLAVGGVALRHLATGRLPPCSLLLLASAGVVLFSVYLAWALVQRLEVSCPLCFASHGLNAAVLLAFAAACALS